MANGKAPVCPISRNQALPGMPPRNMPAIPKAVDLASAIAALNQIALLLNPPVNSGASDGPAATDSIFGGRSDPNQDDGSGGGGKGKAPHWGERSRDLVPARVTNPDDPSIFIVFPHIVSLFYVEEATHVDLRWYL